MSIRPELVHWHLSYLILRIYLTSSTWMMAERCLFICCRRIQGLSESWHCGQNLLLWLHGDHEKWEVVYIYVGGSSHALMVRHRALCVMTPNAPGVHDFRAVPSHPALGAECSQDSTFHVRTSFYGLQFASSFPRIVPSNFSVVTHTR